MRIAFRMKVHAGMEDEYRRRHNPIWPRLEQALQEHGVESYSIFLDPESLDLFAYAEVEDLQRWQAIAKTEVCQEWWQSMRTLMPSNDDGSPVSRPLAEVFHIER